MDKLQSQHVDNLYDNKHNIKVKQHIYDCNNIALLSNTMCLLQVDNNSINVSTS
jgi:hypothetical protein